MFVSNLRYDPIFQLGRRQRSTINEEYQIVMLIPQILNQLRTTANERYYRNTRNINQCQHPGCQSRAVRENIDGLFCSEHFNHQRAHSTRCADGYWHTCPVCGPRYN